MNLVNGDARLLTIAVSLISKFKSKVHVCPAVYPTFLDAKDEPIGSFSSACSNIDRGTPAPESDDIVVILISPDISSPTCSQQFHVNRQFATMSSSQRILRSTHRLTTQWHPHDFLTPALRTVSRRTLATTTIPPPPNPEAQKPKPRKPLTKSQRDYLSSAVCPSRSFLSISLPRLIPPSNPLQLRVNQAGELAATLIYAHQTPPIITAHPRLRPLMKHMYDQEAAHLTTFNALIAKHRVRPTAMYPVWSLLSSGLGWATGAMGREAAMACTEAVETEIGTHYNAQIRELLSYVASWEEEGYEVSEEVRELLGTLRRIRDEELEHLDHAVGEDAKKAEPYWLLTGVIRAGCRGAIWVSEKV